MADDEREKGNCPKCGAALIEFGSFSANYSACNKCDYKWSIISKPIEEFCFSKCPKCGGTDLQCGCGDKRMCNACSFLWVVGSEEEGSYNTTDGQPASSKSSTCCGGCCNKDVAIEKKDQSKSSSCPGGCCKGGGGCCCGGGCCGGCCGGKGKQADPAKPAEEAPAAEAPLWFTFDISMILEYAP